MSRYDDYCVCCTSIGLPCYGASCPNRQAAEYEDAEEYVNGEDDDT